MLFFLLYELSTFIGNDRLSGLQGLYGFVRYIRRYLYNHMWVKSRSNVKKDKKRKKESWVCSSILNSRLFLCLKLCMNVKFCETTQMQHNSSIFIDFQLFLTIRLTPMQTFPTSTSGGSNSPTTCGGEWRTSSIDHTKTVISDEMARNEKHVTNLVDQLPIMKVCNIEQHDLEVWYQLNSATKAKCQSMG